MFKKPKNRALDIALTLVAVGIVFGLGSVKTQEEFERDKLRDEYLRKQKLLALEAERLRRGVP